MTIEEEKQVVTDFLKLKFKQLACSLHLKIYGKFAYTGDEIGLMFDNIRIQSNLQDIKSKLMEFYTAHKSYLDTLGAEGVDVRSRELGIRITVQDQEELTKESDCLGYAANLDKLGEQLI